MSLVGVYLGVAAAAMVGLVKTLRSQARSRQYLETALEDAALDLDHLPPAIAGLLVDARALRSNLDGPQRLLDAGGRLGVLGSDAEELDSQLRELSRAMGDWLAQVERLEEADASWLADATSQARDLRVLFREENYAIERARGRGRPPVAERLARVRGHLVSLERELQRAHDPYR